MGRYAVLVTGMCVWYLLQDLRVQESRRFVLH